MCGIAGFFSKDTVKSSEDLESMVAALEHRGPDAEGYFGVSSLGENQFWKRPNAWPNQLKWALGHRRLSILDLSEAGTQPMASDDKRFWISFNGEVYNYIELRRELKTSCKTHTDTEVVLRLFAEQGLGSLAKLNGIFSFAIFDRKERQLTLVRDPLGVKPLYYLDAPKLFLFASEIKSILTQLPGSPKLNRALLSRYLLSNWIPDPDTLFDGISKLEPGHYLQVDEGGSFKKHCYWNVGYQTDRTYNSKQWLEKLDSTLDSVMERQLRSDVPVAFFLSGGVDSSLLTAKALQSSAQPATAFTITFNWSHSKNDHLDRDAARLLHQHYRFQHEEIELKPSILDLLPRVVEVLEEPISDPAAICSYLICEAAGKEFKVLVSGQGGDEVFAGYPVYQGGSVASLLGSLPRPIRTVSSGVFGSLPYSIGGRRWQPGHRIRKLFRSMKKPWPYPFMVLRSALQENDLNRVLSACVAAEQSAPYARHVEHFEEAKSWDRFHQMMYVDVKTYLPNLNLAYTDKTSMAHSVEVRVPFLDLEIVELLSRVPRRFKANLRQTKILLKKLSEPILPRGVIHRKKSGFGLPIRDWLLNDLQPLASDLLGDSRLRSQGLLNPEPIAGWLKEHRERKADHSAKIYTLMTFQLWMERFGVRA